MNYRANIAISEDVENLYSCFKPMVKQELSNRCILTMKKNKKTLLFAIRAQDSVSLRSAVHMVTQSLSVYQRIKQLTYGSRKITTTTNS